MTFLILRFSAITRTKGEDGGHYRAWNMTLATVWSDSRILLDESHIEVEAPPSYFDKRQVIATNTASSSNKGGRLIETWVLSFEGQVHAVFLVVWMKVRQCDLNDSIARHLRTWRSSNIHSLWETHNPSNCKKTQRSPISEHLPNTLKNYRSKNFSRDINTSTPSSTSQKLALIS
jgi:hypothetical protein